MTVPWKSRLPTVPRLLELRRSQVSRRIANELLRVYGVDIPEQVEVGDDLRVRHHGNNIVINEHTTIGDRVTLYHGITIGRADASLVPIAESAFERIVIEDDAVIFPGAVVLGRAGTTVIGRGAVIGANAVVHGSVPQWEIWTGNPASCRGRRDAVEVPSRSPKEGRS
jgi:serine O-acetyltransferase